MPLVPVGCRFCLSVALHRVPPHHGARQRNQAAQPTDKKWAPPAAPWPRVPLSLSIRVFVWRGSDDWRQSHVTPGLALSCSVRYGTPRMRIGFVELRASMHRASQTNASCVSPIPQTCSSAPIVELAWLLACSSSPQVRSSHIRFWDYEPHAWYVKGVLRPRQYSRSACSLSQLCLPYSMSRKRAAQWGVFSFVHASTSSILPDPRHSQACLPCHVHRS